MKHLITRETIQIDLYSKDAYSLSCLFQASWDILKSDIFYADSYENDFGKNEEHLRIAFEPEHLPEVTRILLALEKLGILNQSCNKKKSED